jgi:hypothetical protein
MRRLPVVVIMASVWTPCASFRRTPDEASGAQGGGIGCETAARLRFASIHMRDVRYSEEKH